MQNLYAVSSDTGKLHNNTDWWHRWQKIHKFAIKPHQLLEPVLCSSHYAAVNNK